jgi:hypothetical protein
MKGVFPDISIISSSPQNLEVLLLDCALPPQAIQYTKYYKDYYDKEEKDKPLSQHFIPEAAYWPDLIDFTDDTEVLKLFAVACAYGQIYEPSEGEIECYTARYKNKNYRGFIFTNKLWYILMPFYKLDSDGSPSNEISAIKPIQLAQGRQNAYSNFKSNPQYHDMVRKWIEDRIAGKDISAIISKLVVYQKDFYKKMSTTEPDLLELLKLESIEFDDYISKVKQTKDPTL